jgi:adhesin transport system outer membrane protein
LTIDRLFLGMLVLIAPVPVSAKVLPKFGTDAPPITLSATPAELALDPKLQTALDLGIGSNPNIISARAAAQAAGFDVRSAKWLLFPSLSAEISEVAQDRKTGSYNGFYPSLTVEQPIWTGGYLNGTIRQARQRQSAALAAYQAAALQVALRISDSYQDVVRLFRRKQLLAQSVARYGDMIQTIDRRVAADVSPRVDLELARSRLAQVEQQYSANTAQYDAALAQLRELVGDPDFMPTTEVLLPAIWPQIELGEATAQSLAFSPRLNQLRAEAAAAKTDVDLARSDLAPKLSAQYSYSDFVGHRVGAVLRYQTGRGLSHLTAIGAARARQDESDAKIAASERDLKGLIAGDVAEFFSATSRLESSQTAAIAAHQVHESYMRLFIASRRSWLDVMNSFQETISADITVADTQASALTSLTRLYLLTGRWRLDLNGVRP